MSVKSAEEYTEEMLSEDTFDAIAAINGVTMPSDSVRVFTDGAKAHQMNELMREAADLRTEAELVANDGSMTGNPEADEIRERADKLDARVQELLKELLESAWTFHIRGVARKQWELIDKKWRKEIKAPARKNFEDGPDGEEAFEQTVTERNIERNRAVKIDMVGAAITKVVNGKGQADKKAWNFNRTETLYDSLLESEWEKLYAMATNLTFAHTLFNNAVTQDADFLSKP